jgi:CheY-like chemotaxis protein/predicted regulator of Ras-like GTPase activity (Roadblock/LC7/MglB family)
MAEARNVLVVDDEDVITWAISQGLTKKGAINVETASSGEDALEVMKERDFDLVITDIRMKGMTGFELLSHVRTLYPETGVVVMTAYGSAEAKREANERGSLFYLDKTFEMDEMRQVVQSALHQVDKTRELRTNQDEGFSGEISNLSLVDMVQLHCLSRNTVIMEVSTDDLQGLIGFQDGEVTYAETDSDLVGRDAFLDMLSWTGGQFETTNRTPSEFNIDESWESLLLEASDVIASQAATSANTSTMSNEPAVSVSTPSGPIDMHGLLDGIIEEKGVLAAFIAGDTGILIDQAMGSYNGDTESISAYAGCLSSINVIRNNLEPDTQQNRTILQFDHHRVLSIEAADSRVYLILVVEASGSLADLLKKMNDAAKHLKDVF